MTAMTRFSAFLPGQLPLPAPPMIGAVDVVPSQRVPRAKRLMDILGVLLALPVLVPVFVAIAVAIKLSSKGPVFFRQTRVGQGGARLWDGQIPVDGGGRRSPTCRGHDAFDARWPVL